MLCVQLASYLERGPLMWMMPLHLHVNQKSDYDLYDTCKSEYNGEFGFAKSQSFRLNIIAIRVKSQEHVSIQATLLDDIYVGPLILCIFVCGLNGFVHECMNNMSNVKVHLKTRSVNVDKVF